MKRIITQIIILSVSVLIASSAMAQATSASTIDNSKIDFKDRRAVLTALENFYIGDKTGSVDHKKKSMAKKGAYRYINRDGEYAEFVFDTSSDDSDTTFTEELLSVEIFDKLALAKIRQIRDGVDAPEYKVMLLHKIKGEWKITSIAWGFGIVH